MVVDRQQRRFVRPVFKESSRPARNRRVEEFARVQAEPRIERQIVRARQDVDAVDLEQAQPIDRPAELSLIYGSGRSGSVEPLRGERDLARFGSCQEEFQDRPWLTVAPKARKSANIASGCSNAAKCPPEAISVQWTTSNVFSANDRGGGKEHQDREKRRCRSGP
jgi:hypothetical protein